MHRRSLRSSSTKNTPAKSDSSFSTPDNVASSAKRSRKTPIKSSYFPREVASKDENSGHTDESRSSSDSDEAAGNEASGYEDEDATASEPSSADEIEEVDEYDSEEAERSRKRQKHMKVSLKSRTTSITSKPVKGQELWRPGVKTGLGPGTEVIIDAPRARPAGATPYTDDTVHPNTMLFLEELAQNNDRDWLKRHDPDYRISLADFNTFLECLQERLMQVDETIPELPLKDIIFRIYRDVRFSSDQTPYKTHFSAAWSRTGRKGPFACYYVQLKPGGSFVGGGLWMPEATHVAALRRDIDRKPHKIRRVLQHPALRKHFLGGATGDERVVKAFVEHNSGNALKTKPKAGQIIKARLLLNEGYDAGHRDIALLRLKNFTVGQKLHDKEVLDKGAVTRFGECFAALLPLVTYLNSVVMPDNEQDDVSEESDDAEA